MFVEGSKVNKLSPFSIMVFMTHIRYTSIQTSKQLYKYLLRECKKLPLDASKHYKFMIRQVNNFHEI